MTTCAACNTETTGRRLCEHHIDQLRDRLAALAELWADAHVTVQRQDRMTRSATRSGSAATPWPLNPDAAATLAVIETSMRRWHFVLCHAAEAPRTMDAVIQDLRDHVGYIAHRQAAGQLHRFVGGALEDLGAAIDLPPDRKYLGPCDRCGRDLWGIEGESTARCVCIGAEPILVSQRHRELLDELDHRLGTAREAAIALSAYGERVGESTIHAWAKKKLLTGRGPSPRGELYSYGDIRRLVASSEERRRKKDEQRAAR